VIAIFVYDYNITPIN